MSMRYLHLGQQVLLALHVVRTRLHSERYRQLANVKPDCCQFKSLRQNLRYGISEQAINSRLRASGRRRAARVRTAGDRGSGLDADVRSAPKSCRRARTFGVCTMLGVTMATELSTASSIQI